MTRGYERETIDVRLKGEPSFVMKLTNDELREMRSKAERQLTIFGDGTSYNVRASDMLSLLEELLQRRRSDDGL